MIKESHRMKRMKLIIRVIRVIRWQKRNSTNETNETNNSYHPLAIKETTEYAEMREIYNGSREGQEKKFLRLSALSAVKSKKKYVSLQSILLEFHIL